MSEDHGRDRFDERKMKLKVSVSFDDDLEATSIFRALKVDDDEFITTSIDKNKVIAEVRADSVDSVRRAADDWIACLMSIKKS